MVAGPEPASGGVELMRLTRLYFSIPAIDGDVVRLEWLQRVDLNHQPPSYEHGELPGCSTLRQKEAGDGFEPPTFGL